MKMKKFLSLVLSASMVLSSAGYALAEAPKDVDGTKYEESVTRLTALEVLKGYEDGTFKPGKTITRAEFAKIMANVVGVGSAAEYAKGQTKFNDVPADHWAAGYINVVSDLEVINGYGDGNFGPQDQVTYAQAITMIVRALGYKPMADAKGGYPGGYLAVAAEKDITDDVNVVSTLAATRGDVALMVDNSLEVGLMEQKTYGQFPEYEETDDTLITKKLDVEELNGVVVNIPDTQSALDDNEIEINVDTDDDGDWDKIETVEVLTDANLMTLLGVEVTVWANDDDEVFFIDQETDEDDIMFDTLVDNDTDKGEVTLVVEDDEFEWDEDATVFINFEEEKVKDVNDDMYGYVVLNDKGDIEFANLFDFKEENELVTEVDGDEITIEESVDLDLEDYEDGVYIYNEKFETIDQDTIAEDTVVSYHIDDEEIWMVVVNESVEGTLDRANADEIKVGGEDYDVNEAEMFYSLDNKDEIEEYNSDAESIDDLMDEDVKVILDINKDAKFIYGNVKETSGTMFGLVVKADSTGLDTRVKILTSADEEIIYKFEEEDDFKANESELKENAIVAYELNKDGEIADGKFAAGVTKIEAVFSDDYEGVSVNSFKADDDGYLESTGSSHTRYYNEEDTVYFNIEADNDAEIVKFEDIEDIDDTINTVVAIKDKKGNDLVAVVFDEIEAVQTDYLFGVVIEEPSNTSDGWEVEIKSFDTDVDTYIIAKLADTPADKFVEGNLVKFKINGEDEITDVTVNTNELTVLDTDGKDIKTSNGWKKIDNDAVLFLLEDDRDIDKEISYSDLDDKDVVQYFLDEDNDKIAALVKLDKETANNNNGGTGTDEGTVTYIDADNNIIYVDDVPYVYTLTTLVKTEDGSVIEAGLSGFEGGTGLELAVNDKVEDMVISNEYVTSLVAVEIASIQGAGLPVTLLITELDTDELDPEHASFDAGGEVADARTDYDALTPGQKDFVTNYSKLVAAEAALANADALVVAADKGALTISGDLDNVIADLTLATSGASGSTITWASNDKVTVKDSTGGTLGEITEPSFTDGDKEVTLTATVTSNAVSENKLFTVTVKALAATNAEKETLDAAALTVAGDLNNVTADLTLPTAGAMGSTIAWVSSNTAIVANDGTVVRPAGANVQITLTATVDCGGATVDKVFYVTVLAN